MHWAAEGVAAFGSAERGVRRPGAQDTDLYGEVKFRLSHSKKASR